MNNFIEQFKKEIEHFSPSARAKDVGIVTRVQDGVAEIEGLSGASMSEMLTFDIAGGKSLEKALHGASEVIGLVLNLEEESIRAIVLGDASLISEGMQVTATGKVLSIPVGEALVGRVISPLGEALDGQGPIKASAHNAIEREAYGVMDRQSVKEPMHTGIKAIDSMIPIGRGQRELIIGDRCTGKTTVAIYTILNQKNEPKEKRPICIYVSIGQKESKTARLVQQLKDAPASTTIV